MRQNFVAQLIKLLKHRLCDVWPGIAIEKNWHLSVDQCPLHVLQFLVHLSDLLSILPRCNGFSRIQKTLVDQTDSRPPNSDHDIFFGVYVALGSALEFLISPTNELVIACCHRKSTFHHMSQSDQEMIHSCCIE